jgi:FkbM family methyltransferase
MYHSQFRQDEILERNIFKELRNGVFVDVGAHDGVWYSNTAFFEKERGWTGICIEPLPELYLKLKEARPNSITLNVAIDNEEGEIEFTTSKIDALSGISKYYDPRHKTRLLKEAKCKEEELTKFKVSTRRLDNVLQENGITRIHYLSIDVEGAELAVIQSIDFDKVFIDIIDFENNYNDKSEPILDLLISKGYDILQRIGCDIIMINEKSEFFQREKDKLLK